MALQLANRLSPHSVPVLVFAFAAALLLVVPSVASGPLAVREAYLIAAAILILASTTGAPYAALVGVATLPLLRTEAPATPRRRRWCRPAAPGRP